MTFQTLDKLNFETYDPKEHNKKLTALKKAIGQIKTEIDVRILQDVFADYFKAFRMQSETYYQDSNYKATLALFDDLLAKVVFQEICLD